MKATILRYGLYGAITGLAFFVVTQVFERIAKANFDVQEILGYLGILVCLVFVYFGVRYYRDTVNSGKISFLQALGLGLMIMLVPAVCFALTDTLYIVLFNPHFYEKYSAHMLEQLSKSVPPAQLAAKMKAMRAEMEMFKSPVANFVVMFVTVAAMGTIVSLVSALILHRRSDKTVLA